MPRILGALSALGVFAASAYLLVTASPMLQYEAIAWIGLPLGNLIVWAGIIALPLACYLGFYEFLAEETRTSRIFRFLVRALLVLSAAWGPVCYALAGNWAFNFDGGTDGFRGGVEAAMTFWVYSVSLVGVSLLVAGFLLAFRLAAARAGDSVSPEPEQEEPKSPRKRYWWGLGIAVFGGLFVLWMNLAVGIIGAPGNLGNLLYVAVLAIGLGGAAVSRFRPRGLANTLWLMAIAQVLVAVVTIAFGLGTPPTPAVSYVVLNVILLAFWISAARLVSPDRVAEDPQE